MRSKSYRPEACWRYLEKVLIQWSVADTYYEVSVIGGLSDFGPKPLYKSHTVHSHCSSTECPTPHVAMWASADWVTCLSLGCSDKTEEKATLVLVLFPLALC